MRHVITIRGADGPETIQFHYESEVVDYMRELVSGWDGGPPDQAARDTWNRCSEILEDMRDYEASARSALGRGEGSTEGLNLDSGFRRENAELFAGRASHERQAALRAIEANREHLSAEAGDRLDRLVRTEDASGLDSRYIVAVSNDHYRSAFGKMLRFGPMAPMRFTPEEAEAVQQVNAAEELRTTLQVGSDAAGGFAVPFTLDPSIVLTSSGVQNPVREFARVETLSTDKWKGVSSAGITAAFAAELTEASDNAPVLAQPTADSAKAQAFVPFSIEIGQDWGAIEAEMGRLLADAKATLESTEFLSGNGVDRPFGILSGATTMVTGGSTVFAVADCYALMQAVPPRFQANMAVAGNPTTYDNTYRLIGGNSTEPPVLPTREGAFLGRRKFEWSSMATYPTANARALIAGDWSFFLVADRIGLSIELIPHLFGGSNRFPIGARGFYCYWRTATTVLSANAFRVLIRP